MSQVADDIQARAKAFALRVIRLVEALPATVAGREIGRQLLRSATSVSANYRAARHARSRKEFIAKLGVVVEESDESHHWLDLLIDAELMSEEKAGPLRDEADELTRIFASTRRSAIARNRTARQQRAASRFPAAHNQIDNNQITNRDTHDHPSS